jgi:hypothetical protein
MDASQLRDPKTVYSVPKHKSNWVEWMLHNFGTPKRCIEARNTSFAFCYLSKVSELFWNTPKHQTGSNGVEWMLHNFGTPNQCLQSRNTSFASFYLSKVSEILQNTTKRHFGSNGDVSRLGYPEIVHWGSDACFASCYLSKVSEMIRNTPKHHFGSNEVEWMLHNFGSPK